MWRRPVGGGSGRHGSLPGPPGPRVCQDARRGRHPGPADGPDRGASERLLAGDPDREAPWRGPRAGSAAGPAGDRDRLRPAPAPAPPLRGHPQSGAAPGAAPGPGADGPRPGPGGARPSQPAAADAAGGGHPGGRERPGRRHLVQPAVSRQAAEARDGDPGEREGDQQPSRAHLPEPPVRAGERGPPARRPPGGRVPGDRRGHLQVPPGPDRPRLPRHRADARSTSPRGP